MAASSWRWLAAALCAGGISAARPPKPYDVCEADVQAKLRFGISGRTEPDVPVPVAADETLSEAVCCDVRTQLFAEPQRLFAAPDIALFDKITHNGTTVFFDSVCGIPLFRAPVDRSFEDFRKDSDEHGVRSSPHARVRFVHSDPQLVRPPAVACCLHC